MFAVFLCLYMVISNGVFGDEVKSVSVMEGDSVTLNTDLTHIQTRDHHIEWIFKGSLIAEIEIKANVNSICYDTDGIFRDKLQMDSQTGSLIITNISITNSGLYKLQINNNRVFSYKRFNVTVYARLPVPVITINCSQYSSSSSSSSISSCMLLCSVMNVSHVTLSWYKGNRLLSNISVSDLNISLSLSLEVEYQDTNTYSCVINNPITNHTQHLNIKQLCHTCSECKVSCLVLALILVFVVLICGIIFIFYWETKRRREGAPSEHDCNKELKTLSSTRNTSSFAMKKKHLLPLMKSSRMKEKKKKQLLYEQK